MIRIDALWLATQPIDRRADDRLAVRLAPNRWLSLG